MAISFKSGIPVPKQVLVRTFQNESVLLNLERPSYHGLNDMRTRTWRKPG